MGRGHNKSAIAKRFTISKILGVFITLTVQKILGLHCRCSPSLSVLCLRPHGNSHFIPQTLKMRNEAGKLTSYMVNNYFTSYLTKCFRPGRCAQVRSLPAVTAHMSGVRPSLSRQSGSMPAASRVRRMSRPAATPAAVERGESPG